MGLLETDRVYFPSISESLKHQFGLRDLWLRSFGQAAEDREVNFDRPLRLDVEIAVLECCTGDSQGGKLDPSFFWNLEVGKRIECLLAIATIQDRDAFMIPLRCLNLACQEGLEIDFSMAELSGIHSTNPIAKSPEICIGRQKVRIRRPTGVDQLQWLEQSFQDEFSATQSMLETLVLEDDRSQLDAAAIAQGEWISAFNQIMEEIDPLVNFQVQVQCPHCSVENSQPIDFGAFALQRLRNYQQQLFDLVHRLASRYHWNEPEIFAIPAWRRQYYLARIDREENR
jgi:hypothetical protein